MGTSLPKVSGLLKDEFPSTDDDSVIKIPAAEVLASKLSKKQARRIFKDHSLCSEDCISSEKISALDELCPPNLRRNSDCPEHETNPGTLPIVAKSMEVNKLISDADMQKDDNVEKLSAMVPYVEPITDLKEFRGNLNSLFSASSEESGGLSFQKNRGKVSDRNRIVLDLSSSYSEEYDDYLKEESF